MSATTTAPLLALLREKDGSVRSYALHSINKIVDERWSEISNDLPDIEALYDDTSFADRKMAALIAAKVYYNLSAYDVAVKYALAAEECFDVSEKTEFVETIVSKSIEIYIQASARNYNNPDDRVEIDPKLTSVFERMLEKCVSASEYKLALGIALEGYRLDLVESILKAKVSSKEDPDGLKLINYVLTTAMSTVSNLSFRDSVLSSLFGTLISMDSVDYFTASKVVISLNKPDFAVQLFEKLIEDDNLYIAYQIALDFVSSASQGLLFSLISRLKEKNYDKTLLDILSGFPTCDLYNTFLYENRNIDVGLLNKSKSCLDGKFSLFHNAVSIANGFMHAGTTDNSFIKANLPWLGKAHNWAKFTATASLGVVHKGNLVDGKRVMGPYLPGNRSASRYIKGGSLYGLGLLYAGFGRDILPYLTKQLEENTRNIGDEDVDVLLHGVSLGVGLAAMGSSDAQILESLKDALYNDSATVGEAAALGIGLVMLGSGDEDCNESLFTFAHETRHGNIRRGIGVGLALINYGCQEHSDELIRKMISDEDPLIRYGGAFAISMAYVGTSNNKAVKKLLHIAVSDSNDDVRRAAVTALGFVLLRDYTTLPRIVELLSKSHNAHVRCGTAFALGIACAGKALPSAVEVLEPLTRDPVDFVRQAAYIALGLIMIQQTDKLNPKVAEMNKMFLNVITSKHQEGLAKFGACVAQGIMNAGGRNVTIQLENSETGTLDTKSIVGLVMFSQFWYWFPLAHFLSLSFTPTAIIGVRATDMAIPKFELNCYGRQEVFEYPAMYEEEGNKEIEKVATAILSTTARAKARAKKVKKEKNEKRVKDERNEGEKEEEEKGASKGEEAPKAAQEDSSRSRYSSKPYKIENMSRVLPQQAKYVSFIKGSRFVPVRKSKSLSGVIVMIDTQPDEPIDIIETIRQRKDVNAPLPAPFKVEDQLDFDSL